MIAPVVFQNTLALKDEGALLHRLATYAAEELHPSPDVETIEEWVELGLGVLRRAGWEIVTAADGQHAQLAPWRADQVLLPHSYLWQRCIVDLLTAGVLDLLVVSTASTCRPQVYRIESDGLHVQCRIGQLYATFHSVEVPVLTT